MCKIKSSNILITVVFILEWGKLKMLQENLTEHYFSQARDWHCWLYAFGTRKTTFQNILHRKRHESAGQKKHLSSFLILV